MTAAPRFVRRRSSVSMMCVKGGANIFVWALVLLKTQETHAMPGGTGSGPRGPGAAPALSLRFAVPLFHALLGACGGQAAGSVYFSSSFS